jgi:hypothetical protein
MASLHQEIWRIFRPNWKIFHQSEVYSERSHWIKGPFVYFVFILIVVARDSILTHNDITGRPEMEWKRYLKIIQAHLKIMQSKLSVFECTLASSVFSSIGRINTRDEMLIYEERSWTSDSGCTPKCFQMNLKSIQPVKTSRWDFHLFKWTCSIRFYWAECSDVTFTSRFDFHELH